MIKKIVNPVFISFALLFIFMLIYIYQNIPKQSFTPRLIDGPIDNFCINQNCLKKENDLWWFQDKFPADPKKVEDFASGLLALKLDNLISNNSSKFDQLGFSKDDPLTITVGQINFWLSSSIQNISDSLIKLPSDQVYRVAYLGKASDLRQETYWQKLYLTNLPSYQVQKISINSSDKSFETDSQSDTWPSQDYIDLIVYLPVLEYLSNQTQDSIKTYQIYLTTDDGSTSGLNLGLTKDGIFWAGLDDNLYYKIDKSHFDKLTSILF